MNSAKDANITENSQTVVVTTAEAWSCDAPPTHKKGLKASEPALTTEPVAPVVKKVVYLKLTDPYPTWPFTQVEPRSLSRWCKKNLPNSYPVEDALI